MSASLEIRELAFRIGRQTILHDFDLTVGSHEVVLIRGRSGVGKSTLLRLVAGLQRPSAGEIRIGGTVVSSPSTWVAPERRDVGMVFQDLALFPHLTVEKNLAFGVNDRAKAEQKRLVGELLERFALKGLGGRYPHELSGGQRQRVAIARALAPSPRILLMDEPFSSLDRELKDAITAETFSILRATRTAVLYVTHEGDEADRFADRSVKMDPAG